jgi:hypothetical protein
MVGPLRQEIPDGERDRLVVCAATRLGGFGPVGRRSRSPAL